MQDKGRLITANPLDKQIPPAMFLNYIILKMARPCP